jgi:hypothetical protein
MSRDFLNRADEPNDIRLIEVARQRTNPSPPTEMLARAALLLRTATAVTTKQLHAAGFVAPVDYEFWLGPFAEQRALSGLPSIPSPTFDLWSDVSDALEEIRELRNSRLASGQPTRSHDLAEMISNCIPRIGEAERIALWGFCLN